MDQLPNKAPIDLVGYGVNRQVQQPGGQDWIWDDSTVARKVAPTELVSGQFQHSDGQLRLALNPGGGSGGLCFGDSGGPDLRGGSDVVLAVNSWVNNSNCAGVGYGSRIDNEDILKWIKGYLEAPPRTRIVVALSFAELHDSHFVDEQRETRLQLGTWEFGLLALIRGWAGCLIGV